MVKLKYCIVFVFDILSIHVNNLNVKCLTFILENKSLWSHKCDTMSYNWEGPNFNTPSKPWQHICHCSLCWQPQILHCICHGRVFWPTGSRPVYFTYNTNNIISLLHISYHTIRVDSGWCLCPHLYDITFTTLIYYNASLCNVHAAGRATSKLNK